MTDLDARPQVALVKKLLDAFFTCDFKTVELLTSKNYEYHPLPESMGLPKEERGEHLQRVRALFSLFKKIEVTYHEVIEAPGKVVTHTTRVLSTPQGEKITFSPVAIFTLAEEDGELKVVCFKDFGDPKGRTAVYAWARKAVAEQAA